MVNEVTAQAGGTDKHRTSSIMERSFRFISLVSLVGLLNVIPSYRTALLFDCSVRFAVLPSHAILSSIVAALELRLIVELVEGCFPCLFFDTDAMPVP